MVGLTIPTTPRQLENDMPFPSAFLRDLRLRRAACGYRHRHILVPDHGQARVRRALSGIDMLQSINDHTAFKVVSHFSRMAAQNVCDRGGYHGIDRSGDTA